MIRINLLPFRAARKKENVRRQVSVFILSIVLICAGMAYYNSMLGGQVDELNGKVDAANAELLALKKKANEAAKLKKELDTLQKKIDVIDELSRNREEAVRLLDTMTQMVVPERMWLTAFRATDDKVNLSGIAMDNRTVADFMTRLEGNERFSDVILSSTRQEEYKGGVYLKSFSLSFTKAPLKKEEPEKGKK